MTKEFKHIKNVAVRREAESLKKEVARVKAMTKDDIIKSYYRSFLTVRQQEKTTAEIKKIIVEKLKKKSQKTINDFIIKCDLIANAPDVKEININVEWAKNRTWGANPTAEVWAAGKWTTGKASGYGYDKLSAAIAQAFNQNYSILKLLYSKYDKVLSKNIKAETRDVLGYGSGYYQKPHFDGGVGYNCFRSIFKDLGAKVNTWQETKTSDTMTIIF